MADLQSTLATIGILADQQEENSQLLSSAIDETESGGSDGDSGSRDGDGVQTSGAEAAGSADGMLNWVKVQFRLSILAWILGLVAFATNGWCNNADNDDDNGTCGIIYCVETTSQHTRLYCTKFGGGCEYVWATRILLLLSILIGIFAVVCTCCGMTDPYKLISFAIVILFESSSGFYGIFGLPSLLGTSGYSASTGYSIVLLAVSVALYCVAASIACMEFYKKQNQKDQDLAVTDGEEEHDPLLGRKSAPTQRAATSWYNILHLKKPLKFLLWTMVLIPFAAVLLLYALVYTQDCVLHPGKWQTHNPKKNSYCKWWWAKVADLNLYCANHTNETHE